MRGKHRNIVIPRNFPASLSIGVNEEQTHKDKPLPEALFIPADSVCLRCVSSFHPLIV